MPDKHEVGGSSPLGPTSTRKDAAQTEDRVISLLLSGRVWAYQLPKGSKKQMLIENRIKKKETNR